MRKVLIALAISSAVIGAGMFAWKAEATTGTAAATLGATAKNYSPVQRRPPASDGGATALRGSAGHAVPTGAGAGLARLSATYPQAFRGRPRAAGGLVLFDPSQGRSRLRHAFTVNADRAAQNFNNLRFTHGRESLRIAQVGLREMPSSGWRRYPGPLLYAGHSNRVIGSVRRRLNHDELTLPSVCLRSRRGLDEQTRGSHGVLGCRCFGAAGVVPVSRDGRAESRTVVGA
jgi:hypothetical protein